MKQKYLVIDVKYCHDCNNCFLACKDEHVMNDWMPYTEEQPRHGHRWLNIHRLERGQAPRVSTSFLPMMCQHCSDAPCMKANPDAFERRDDGIVMIIPDKARGKKEIVDSCPYEAIYWNEEKNVPQKCTMCAHLMDDPAWMGMQKMPRCVHGCPTEAMKFYEMEPADFEAMAKKEGLSNHRPELGTKGNVYYKNYHRFVQHFITGAILRDKDAYEGATVTLKGDGKMEEQETDYFGEYKFDALNPGAYTLLVNGKEVKAVDITESLNVGEITV